MFYVFFIVAIINNAHLKQEVPKMCVSYWWRTFNIMGALM